MIYMIVIIGIKEKEDGSVEGNRTSCVDDDDDNSLDCIGIFDRYCVNGGIITVFNDT